MAILGTDNFVRANNADLGTNWDENTGDSDPGGFNISTNTAIPNNRTQDSSETWNAVAAPNNQYAEATLGTTAADGVGAGSGVVCRSATAAKTFYRLVGNASGYEFGRVVAATFTSLSSGAGTTFTSGDKIKLETVTNGANCDWVLKKNGTSFATGSDTSPIASGRFGVGHSSTSSVGAGVLTGWEGGDFTAGTIPPVVYRMPQVKFIG